MDELSQRNNALSLAYLSSLSGSVAKPSYRREEVTAGIVHFGVGNFHRAHMAVYLDALMNQGLALDWGIIGAGVTPYDHVVCETLRKQDYLTTVVEQDATHVAARVTGAMIGFADPDDIPGLIRQLTDPAIRLVSLTITEGGYFLDAQTGAFDTKHPAIVADATQPEKPATVFGILIAALKARRAVGVPPFTVMCCDNIPHNGVVTRNAIVGLARLSDPAFADWVDANLATPSSMVDRITPATTDRERADFHARFGYADGWPVFCETFTQWVLEDHFPSGRPPFERAGATFSDNVVAYELMKLRILNGGHAAIAYPAGLLDIQYVHDAMASPLVSGFLSALETREIIPGVPPVPGVDLNSYFTKVAERFSNPRVGDTVRRLCLDGSNRQPKFIVPAIEAALSAGGAVEGLALESALWCRYCYGSTETGSVIEPNDPNWDRLTVTAAAARQNPRAWLDMRDIYGSVSDHPGFANSFSRALDALWRDGVKETLQRYIADKPQHG